MRRGDMLVFVTRDAASGAVAGSTSYLAITPAHRRLEIGATWLLPPYHGVGHNVEAKYLQLGHAFDVLGAVRVELKTDSRNARSRAAILALGATEEGTLRRHTTNPDGYVRDSVYFSVIREEWPEVKARLEARLVRKRARNDVPAADRPFVE
jgi:RimJ/RimL family protein N-acetyltransferase